MAFSDKVATIANQNKDKMFEDMDVDYVENTSKKNIRDGGSEEGEVSEDEDTAAFSSVPEVPSENKLYQKPERRFDNRAGGFITGMDVFGKEEQARLVERAKRFGLDSSNTHTLSEKKLKKLYWSVGADQEDSDSIFRFDSLKMYGTEAMSTKDIFEYFSDYAPSSIQWLSDNSCNVIWLDNLSAVRALLGLSKPVKYPPSMSKSSDKSKNKKMVTDKSSKHQESDIIMVDDDSGEESRITEDFAAEVAADPEAVDLDELVGVPPGRWRKGKTHPHSDSILLRFARRTNGSAATEQDGRPTRLPQPMLGMVGLISSSRKQKIKKGLLVRPKHFQDDMGDERDFVISSDEDDNRNPWGTLAKSWGHIDRARRPIAPEAYEEMFRPFPTSPPPPPALILPRLPPTQPIPILSRVGFREPITSRLRRPSRVISRSPSFSPERLPVSRRRESREYSRRLAEKRKRTRDSSEKSSGSGSDSDEEWKKRVKVPRMRMYADEEEKRSKERSKVVNSRPGSSFGQTDLRNRLQLDRPGHSRRTPPPSSSHRARSPYRREDSRRRNDRESARRPVRDGASSVWLRLERPSSGLPSVVTKLDDSDVEYDSSSYESSTSSSSESESDRVTVRSTARYAHQSDDDAETRPSYSSRSNGRSTENIDLRSKLNKKLNKNKSASTSKPRSPLRIEIDNDEYYRLVEGGKE